MKGAASQLNHDVKAKLEKEMVLADKRLQSCPSALAIPTAEPLDSFGARTVGVLAATHVRRPFETDARQPCA